MSKPAKASQRHKSSNAKKRRRHPPRPTKLTLVRVFSTFTNRDYADRVKEQNDTFLEELRDAYLHRGLVLYLGAGVSQSVGLPGWSELIRSLTVTAMSRKLKAAVFPRHQARNRQSWKAFRVLRADLERLPASKKPILMVARTVKDELEDRLPGMVARNLYDRIPEVTDWLFDPTPPPGPPPLPTSSLLEAIVALARPQRSVEGVKDIVNYNYDDLVDETLRRAQVRCLTVRSGKDEVPPDTLPCYHVHGVLPLQNYLDYGAFRGKAIGNFVFSEDEYHEEYADPYRWSNMTQTSLLSQHTGLLIGLSLDDPNLRRLIDLTHSQYPKRKHYAIVTRSKKLGRGRDSGGTVLRNLFEKVDSDSFDRMGINILWVNGHSEVPRLLKRISALDRKRRAPVASEETRAPA